MTATRFLNAAELAQLLGVTESTVMRRFRAGEIPGDPIGKNGVVFVRDDLVADGILPKPDDPAALAEGEAGA